MTAPIPRDLPDLPPIPGVARLMSPLVPARTVLPPPARRPMAAAFRVLVALAAVTAVGIELIMGSPLRALSHWSIQCGLLVAVVFALSAVRAWTADQPLPPVMTGGTVLCTWVAGLVHHLILTRGVGAFALTGVEAGTGAAGPAAFTGLPEVTAPLLHTAIPLAVAADWLLLTRPRALRPAHAAAWLLGPLTYLGFTLARGELLADKSSAPYLYPFLDAASYGYRSVLANALIVGLAIYALAITLVAVDRFRPNLLRTRHPGPRGRRGPDDRIGPRDRWDEPPENRISSPATSGLE